MARAPKAVLEALHAALANTFKDILENGETAVDKDTGEAVKVTPGASTLNAIRQFLKDNQIEAGPTNDSLQDLGKKLTVSLPFERERDDFGLPQ